MELEPEAGRQRLLGRLGRRDPHELHLHEDQDDIAATPTEIREVASAARQRSPAAGDDRLRAVRRAGAGTPILVHEPDGEPSFWLVPFLVNDLACGFAHLTLEGRVIRIGTYGAGPDEKGSWLPEAFFAAPPPDALAEIRARHAALEQGEPFFGFDGSPTRLAWTVELRRGANLVLRAFMTPAGWHVRPPGDSREGG